MSSCNCFWEVTLGFLQSPSSFIKAEKNPLPPDSLICKGKRHIYCSKTSRYTNMWKQLTHITLIFREWKKRRKQLKKKLVNEKQQRMQCLGRTQWPYWQLCVINVAIILLPRADTDLNIRKLKLITMRAVTNFFKKKK
jgi:hypothetical protein